MEHGRVLGEWVATMLMRTTVMATTSAIGNEDPIAVKERQSLIDVEHASGLLIGKPVMYKKSLSVTRYGGVIDATYASLSDATSWRGLRYDLCTRRYRSCCGLWLLGCLAGSLQIGSYYPRSSVSPPP
jgi:hypothetical protein